ncbi:methyltransferase [Dictyobacter alpinus]|uniref:Methyltransferase n=1 Tax=Dictyobacter alpinus TaxID=2014873 RepID=A0A402BET0_9CHLR|nr:class I SAM-dependent methyltransferase [Dictyobacter alpinus]GCE29898.1 methyltransferase [Dictyobacter alpinus]
MDWIKPFYTKKSEWFGPSGVLDHHRTRAASIEKFCGTGPKRILELGAGAGGTAAAMADLGHTVVAIELSSLRTTYAKALAEEPRAGSLTILEADYYEVNMAEKFDLVCHWDSFGMGDDEDQRRLLQRIADAWLAPGGCVLMDIFSPWWWAQQAGKVETDNEPGLTQRYDFDPIGCRFIDQWWPTNDQSQIIAQTVRCYTPVDLTLLVKGTGLAIELLEIDDTPIPLSETSTMKHALWNTASYVAKLIPAVS